MSTRVEFVKFAGLNGLAGAHSAELVAALGSAEIAPGPWADGMGEGALGVSRWVPQPTTTRVRMVTARAARPE